MNALRSEFRYDAGCRYLLAILLLLVAGCAQEVPQPSGSDSLPDVGGSTDAPSGDNTNVQSAGEPLDLLVTVDQLQQQLDRKDLRVVDARPANDYDAGHVPGAVRVDVAEWKALTMQDNAAGLHDAAAWSEAVGGIGIDRGTSVVVYSSSPTDAARIWWIMKYVGVENVGLLDGGWEAWKSAGAEVSTETAKVEAVSFEPSFQDDRLSLITDLKVSHASGDLVVVDARSVGEFAGEGEGKGRIPGAVHLEWKELLTEDGRYKPVEELKQIFKQHGITADKTAVTHCQSGGRASVNIFAMELAGFGKVKNYYCGWSEWGKDESAPREQGKQ